MTVGQVLLAREDISDQAAAVGSAGALLRRSPPNAAKLLLPVWGYRYVRQFLETSLPTLLAPGNVPALASALDCEFVILTSEDDRDYINEHRGFKRLSGVCRTDIRTIDHLITDGNHSTTITIAYAEAVRSVGPAMTDTCFFFLVSDYVVADGSLKHAFDRMRRGASAVVVGNFQVEAERAAPWLRNRLRTDDPSLAMTPRELMRWALNYLHPATVANTVNLSLGHNSHTNRLFWRVDRSTVLGRFYLMHMLCVRPELPKFTIGASCDYSFVPEMCPSGNVEIITDSDEYLVIEMQPHNHEAAFLRAGPLPPKALAKSLAEWTTAMHRANAYKSLIFHAEDLPSGLDAYVAQADAFVENVAHAIKSEPQPHRGHPYWRGAVTAFEEATRLRLKQEDWYVGPRQRSVSDRVKEWVLWRAKDAVFGRAPWVRLSHPGWADFRLVLQALAPFFNNPGKRMLVLSNTPTALTIALADRGKRVQRLRCGPFLQRSPELYRRLEGRFDICLLELSEEEMVQGAELIDRIAPLMKADGAILVSVGNRRSIGRAGGFGQAVGVHSLQFARPGAMPEDIQYVPANFVRWSAYRGLGRLRALAGRWPIVVLPIVAVCGCILIALSGLGNLDRLRRVRRTVPRGICSSFLMRLRTDRRGAKAALSYFSASSEAKCAT